MSSTRRVVVAGTLLVGLVLAYTSALAGDLPVDEPTSALEFRLDSDFSLEHLAGTTVSWRHFSSETSSWRLGVSPGYRRSEANSADYMQESLGRSLSVEWQQLRGFATRSRARPYWGLGVLAGVASSQAAVTFGGQYEQKQESTTYQAGLLGTLGAEFVIADRVTLGAEYASTLTWSYRRELYLDSESGLFGIEADSRRTTYALQTRAVALTVGILF